MAVQVEVDAAPKLANGLPWRVEGRHTPEAVGVVDSCYRAGGGGVARDSASLQQRFRDIHTFSQHAAVAEEFMLQMGAALMGQPTGLFT